MKIFLFIVIDNYGKHWVLRLIQKNPTENSRVIIGTKKITLY